MVEAAQYLTELGNSSLGAFWFPVILWTLLALVVAGILRYSKIPPLIQYHTRAAVLLSLPAGIGLSILFSTLNEWLTETTAATTKFIVVQAPAVTVSPGAANPAVAPTAMDWSSPGLWLGAAAALIALAALAKGLKLLADFIGMRIALRSYRKSPLTELPALSDANRRAADSMKRTTLIAFSGDVDVPFAWGIRKPVMVLPENLRDDPDRLNMVVRHELMHIRRNDYLLNLFLLLVKTAFWFHPMVYRIYRTLREYREISCDREVLTDRSISQKQYAEILTELAPKTEPGQLSTVSMAVNPSTLMKRINTMRESNQPDTTIKKSVLIALFACFTLTGIIGCSDMEQSDRSGEELLNQNINLTNASIEINGKTVAKNLGPGIADQNELSWPANGILTFIIGEYGAFLVSGQKFEGAEPAGKVDGNQLAFTVNEMNVSITASGNILDRETATLWIAHDASLIKPGDKTSHIIKFFTKFEDFSKYRERYKADDGELQQTGEQKSFFIAVEDMPSPVGGPESLYSNLEYPETARKAGIEGRVIVEFIVNKQGEVENPEIIRGIGGGCDMEALRAIRNTQFEPGKQRGKPVRVKMSWPVIFKLPGESSSDVQKKDSQEGNAAIMEETPQPVGGVESITHRIAYPQSARKAGIEGDVLVRFTVTQNGAVENPEIVRTAGGDLGEEVVRTIRQIQFEPATKQGEPVRSEIYFPVRFNLVESGHSDDNSTDISKEKMEVPANSLPVLLVNGYGSADRSSESAPKIEEAAMKVTTETPRPGVITGRVLDKETGEPLFAANIVVMEHSIGTASDQEGNFTITNVPAGEQRIRVSYVGYEHSFITLKIN